MAWFSGVLQDVRSRGNGLRERVREQAKALQRGVGIEKPSIQSQAFLLAQEAENRIEAEASRLSQCQSGSEVLERWLALLRTAPRRYTDGDARNLRQLSFKQVFLRSRALELALDASGRSVELRQALRTYALAAPNSWPESCPPPMAFARAFVALLWSTVGPTEKWLQMLGTLLSSEQTPHAGNEAEEPCHTWLVQLISGQRQNWQVSDVVDRESEILALEEKAVEALKEAEDGGEPCDSSFSEALRRLSTLTAAVSAVETMADRRSALAEDVTRAIVAEEEQHGLLESTSSSVATAATALAKSLSSGVAGTSGAEREQLCSKSDGIKDRLQELEPEMERLAQEIAAAEEVQSELMQQLKQNKEHLESLRRQRDVRRKEEEHLHHTLHRTEKKLATQMATEDAVRQRCEASQALAFAVADVAENLKAKDPENGSSGGECEVAPLMLTQQRNARQQKELLLLMATGEVRRLKKAAEAAREALPLAEELASSKPGKASEDPVDAEVASEDSKDANPLLQDLRQCIRALKTCRAEKLTLKLEEERKDSSEGNAEAAGLLDELRKRSQACGELLEQLEAIPLPFDEEKDCWEVVEDHERSEAFLFGAREEHPQEREPPFGWDTSGLKNLFNGFAARAVGSAAPPGASAAADDPFLLDGLEVVEENDSKEVVPEVVEQAAVDAPKDSELTSSSKGDTDAPEILEEVSGDPPTRGGTDTDPAEILEKEVEGEVTEG